MMTRKIHFSILLIFTLSSCSPIALTEAPTPPATMQAVTPTFTLMPAPSTTPVESAKAASEATIGITTPEIVKGHMILVDSPLPQETQEMGFNKYASTISLGYLYEKGLNVYGWPKESDVILNRYYRHLASLPLPDKIQEPDGSTLSRTTDAIEGYLATYESSDNREKRYLLTKVTIPEAYTTAILTADAKDGQYPQVIILNAGGKIISTQRIDFRENDKPDSIISRVISDKEYLILIRNNRMLHDDGKDWIETTTSFFDNNILEELPTGYSILEENNIWKVKSGGKDWAVANPNYNNYWMRTEDLFGHTDITAEYQKENKLGPMIIPDASGKGIQEITDYKIFKDIIADAIIVVDRYGCRVGGELVYKDFTNNEYITAKDALVYVSQIQTGKIFPKPVIIQIQFTSDKYNALNGKIFRLVENDDAGYPDGYYSKFDSQLAPEKNSHNLLTPVELALPTPADIIWMAKVKQLLFYYEKYKPADTHLDSEQIISKIPEQLSCIHTGSEISKCYFNKHKEIRISFVDQNITNKNKTSKASLIHVNGIPNILISSQKFKSPKTPITDMEIQASFSLMTTFVYDEFDTKDELSIYSLFTIPTLQNHPIFTVIP